MQLLKIKNLFDLKVNTGPHPGKQKLLVPFKVGISSFLNNVDIWLPMIALLFFFLYLVLLSFLFYYYCCCYCFFFRTSPYLPILNILWFT